jgi:hypothetical protein
MFNKAVVFVNNLPGIIGTIISILIVLGLLFYGLTKNNLWIAAICLGAIGGLVHELAQSSGKFMLPGMDGNNFVLGGLMGIVDGAIAGVLLMQGQSSPITNPIPFYVTVFLAGLALKGVNDAIQPKPNNGAN